MSQAFRTVMRVRRAMGLSLCALAGATSLTGCERGTSPEAKRAPVPAETTRSPIRESGAYRSQNVLLFADTANRAKKTVGPYTPPSGSPERRELMDSIRNTVQADLGMAAVFVVLNLRSDGQWAFGQLTPQRPNGEPIQPETTPLYTSHPHRHRDGLRVDVIWQRHDGRWQVHAHQIGATDVWWLAHCEDGYGALLPGCG